MTSDTVQARSAIEALRSGVPSRQATAELGTTQFRLRDRFTDALTAVTEGRGAPPLTVAANFGAGKSHLLSSLRLTAEQAGFVTAAVVVSPETPLGTPRAVLRNIVEDARAPHQVGNALRALLAEHPLSEARLYELRQWVRGQQLDDRFAAVLRIYEGFRADEELREQLLADVEDRPLTKSVLRAKLKELGELRDYELANGASGALVHDRLRLLPELYRAAGANGLVVFFDELERLSKFSLNQRLRALTEVGWWAQEALRDGTAVVPVFAMTDLFLQTSVTGGTHDAERFAGDEPRDELGRLAVATLAAHETLDPPDAEQELQVQYRIKGIYERAYEQPVPALPPERYDPHTPLRFKIRKWIARWDLHRYDPDYSPDFAVDAMHFDESEVDDADVADGDE